MEDKIYQIPITEQDLRSAIHELIGFIAGSNMLDSEKKIAMDLPSVKKICSPMYVVPSGTTFMSIRGE